MLDSSFVGKDLRKQSFLFLAGNTPWWERKLVYFLEWAYLATSIEIPNVHTIWSHNFTSRNLCYRNIHIQNNINKTAILFEIAKDRSKHLAMEDMSNKCWDVCFVYFEVLRGMLGKIRQLYTYYYEWLSCENSKKKGKDRCKSMLLRKWFKKKKNSLWEEDWDIKKTFCTLKKYWFKKMLIHI